jgi:predicted HicB family RNase H-like nuclease
VEKQCLINYQSIQLDADDKIFHGRVLGIRALIGFEGETVEGLEKDFRDGVDDYLDICSEEGRQHMGGESWH